MNCKPGDLAWIVGLHPSLGEAEGKRLRELGFDEGVTIEALHSGSMFGRDPIAAASIDSSKSIVTTTGERSAASATKGVAKADASAHS